MNDNVLKRRLQRWIKATPALPTGSAWPPTHTEAAVAGPEPEPEPTPEPAPPAMPEPYAEVPRDENGVPLPPRPPEYVPNGILVHFFPNERTSSFNFWGMPIEDAVTNCLDVLVRLNQIANQVYKLGLPYMPTSLDELDRAIGERIEEMRREQVVRDSAVEARAETVADDELRAAQLRAALRKDEPNADSV